MVAVDYDYKILTLELPRLIKLKESEIHFLETKENVVFTHIELMPTNFWVLSYFVLEGDPCEY
jgi:hypothetical protein